MGGKPPAIPVIDDAPAIPAGAAYLWRWFCEISMGLASNGFSAPVVTWEALAAWQGQMGLGLEPWEAKALIRLGHARAVIAAEKKPGQA